jgi:AcrR family transcriptional regulator
MTGTATAERVREAALRLFVVNGYAGLSMQEVRRGAGISNGSLYHQFDSKAALAAALLVEGMQACQQLVLGILDADPSPDDGVRSTVRAYLGWVEGHREQAALLFADLPDEVLLAAEPALAESSRRYVRHVKGWLQQHMDDDVLVERPFEIAHALWLGPTQELSRHWVRGRSRLRPTKAAPDLAGGAWLALSLPVPTTARVKPVS